MPGKSHTLPDLDLPNAMPSGPVPLSASSQALASKEFSYIVQRAQIQQSNRRKKERRLKRQRALQTEEIRKKLAEEEYARAAAAGEAGEGEAGGDANDTIMAGTEDGAQDNGEASFGDYDGGMDWGAQDDGGMIDYNEDNNMDEDDEDSMYGASPAHDASYAQLCRAHVAAYMRGTHQYAQETNLTRRVTAWEDKLLPVLDQQFHRPQFDIHECGVQLLDTLALEVANNVNNAATKTQAESGSSTSASMDVEEGEGEGDNERNMMAPQFIQLAQKQQSNRYEVCRLFLSMLQLANDRNVELTHDTIDTLPDNMVVNALNSNTVANHLTDSLRVRLLSMNKAVTFKKSGGFTVFEEGVEEGVGEEEVVEEEEREVEEEVEVGATQTMAKRNKGAGAGKHKTGHKLSAAAPLSSLSENVLAMAHHNGH